MVATPIGNLKDISFRALDILKKSKIILCENPNHTLKILEKYDIKKKLLPIHDYNEHKIINKLSSDLNNSIISLVSDAGSPLISDPGFKLVKYCIENKIYVTSIPGSSSVIPAIQLSGISPVSFNFHGFVPKKTNKAEEFFKKIQNSESTQIFFTSSHRLKENIKIIQKVFKNRQIAICREITKINEEIIRMDINQAINNIENQKIKIKGEFIIVIEGSNKKNVELLSKNILGSISLISSKFSLTDTVKIVHKITNISKKKLYEGAIKKLNKK